MTPADCARRACVSLSLVYKLLQERKIPAFRVGCGGRGRWLVDTGDFENWLRTCRVSGPPDGRGVNRT